MATLNILYSASAQNTGDDASITISGIPKGRYSIFLLGVMYNAETSVQNGEFAVSLSVNSDNPLFSAFPDADWTTGSTPIAAESTLSQQGATIKVLTGASNTVQAKAHLRSGTMSRTTKLTAMVCRLYNKEPTAF